MNKEIFRKKSLERIQTPDNLSEYIRIVNPGLWILFIAVFVLLAGAFVWGCFGSIEDKMPVVAISRDGTVVCNYDENIEIGMKVMLGNREGVISSVTSSGITMAFQESIPEGVYSGYVVKGTITPVSFVLN